MTIPRNIRFRVLLLTILTIGPTIALLVYFSLSTLKQAQSAQLLHLENIARLIATEYDQVNEGARQLLISLAHTPQVTDRSQCNSYLAGLLTKYKRYANFGVAGISGNVLCSAVPSGPGTNLSDRYFFQTTLITNDFTIGEYVFSPMSNKSVLNYGYPLPNNQGIVYSSLDLAWLQTIIFDTLPSPDAVVVVFDHNGIILTRYPYPELWIGKSQLVSIPTSGQVIETSGIDGVSRLYAYHRIGDQDQGPFVAVGIPKPTVFATPRQSLITNLLLSLVVAAICLLIGWFIGTSLIVQLVSATHGVEELKRDFVSLVTHQIRTPITAIKWFTQILQSGSPGPVTPTQKDLLADTAESVDRVTHLVDTLLTISKLESGKIPLHLQSTSLTKLIKSSHQIVAQAFVSKAIRFRLLGHSYRAAADPKLISQVIVILLSNAYKYSHPKSVVTLTVSKAGPVIQVAVHDHGIGVPASDQSRIWAKFTRGSNAHLADTEGAGLGLYLAKLIVEGHKGKIWLASSPDAGTTIYFTLPSHTG